MLQSGWGHHRARAVVWLSTGASELLLAGAPKLILAVALGLLLVIALVLLPVVAASFLPAGHLSALAGAGSNASRRTRRELRSSLRAGFLARFLPAAHVGSHLTAIGEPFSPQVTSLPCPTCLRGNPLHHGVWSVHLSHNVLVQEGRGMWIPIFFVLIKHKTRKHNGQSSDKGKILNRHN